MNVWYSHSDHSKTSVFTETIPYKDRIRLHYRDEPTSRHEEVLVNVIQHPNCTEAIISKCGGKFVISVERELVAEVIGETKICVTVHPHSFEEEWPFTDESSSFGHHKPGPDNKQDDKDNHGHGHEHKKGRESSSF